MADPADVKGSRLRTMTPLLVIASFVSLTELVSGLAVTKATGAIQLILTLFVVIFPVVVAFAFFYVLWHRPYVLYGPTEFGEGADVDSYVGAMRPGINPSVGNPLQPTIVENEAVTAIAAATGPAAGEIVAEEPEDWFVLWKNKEYDAAVNRILASSRDALGVGLAYAIAGRIMLEKSREEGLAFFEDTFRTIPGESTPYVWLANVYMETEELPIALRTLDRGIAAGADRTTLVIAKARFIAQKGRAEEGLDMLRSEVAADESARLQLAMAEIYEADEEIAAAAAAYEKVLAIDAVNETALFSLAKLESIKPDKGYALSLFKRLLRVDATKPEYHTYLGNLYLELDLPSLALSSYERANSLAEGKQAWILANIGNLLKNRGFHHGAVEYLERAIALEPRNTYAHERLTAALKGIEAEEKREIVITTARLSLPGTE